MKDHEHEAVTEHRLGEVEHRDLTIMMIDFAGFVAATEAHGDLRATRLAVALLDTTITEARPDDTVVKHIGDAVLCSSVTPTAALAWLQRITTHLDRHNDLPAIRAGMHAGPVIEHRRDVFGGTVNLAARLCASAPPDTLAATATVARQANRQLERISVMPTELKHVAEPVELHLFGLPHDPTAAWSVDPVCRMRVDLRCAEHVINGEPDVAFCSEECMARFIEGRHR